MLTEEQAGRSEAACWPSVNKTWPPRWRLYEQLAAMHMSPDWATRQSQQTPRPRPNKANGRVGKAANGRTGTAAKLVEGEAPGSLALQFFATGRTLAGMGPRSDAHVCRHSILLT